MTVSQHAQDQDPESKAAKWNSAISTETNPVLNSLPQNNSPQLIKDKAFFSCSSRIFYAKSCSDDGMKNLCV